MKSTDININLIDSYYGMLKNLSRDNKRELIARLSKSLESKAKKKDNSWKSLFGSVVLDQPVDKFIQELKKDRHFNNSALEL